MAVHNGENDKLDLPREAEQKKKREAERKKKREAEQKKKESLRQCVCSWKNCRAYQDAFRTVRHPYLDGLVEIKFIKGETAGIALKGAVDRALKIPPEDRRVWKASTPAITYRIARHHFTEAHIQRYLRETPKTYKWTSLFTATEAKKYLYKVDPKETMMTHDKVLYYFQCPNVSKASVKTQFLLMNITMEACSKSKEEAVGVADPSDSKNVPVPDKAPDVRPEPLLVERARRNYETFHNMEFGTATYDMVQGAGIQGWAACTLEDVKRASSSESAANVPPSDAPLLSCKGSTVFFGMPNSEEEKEEDNGWCFGRCLFGLLHGALLKVRRALRQDQHQVELDRLSVATAESSVDFLV